MTKQEYHDLLVEHTKNGNFPCVDKGRTCLYRFNRTAEDKRRCSIGLLIPDGEYKSSIEGTGLEFLCDHEYFKPEWVPKGVSRDQLARIQNAHDSLADHWNAEEFLKFIEEVLNGIQTS